MRIKKREPLFLLVLVLLLLAINYGFIDQETEEFLLGDKTELVLVDRVVDGDTIEAEGKPESIRLLGINTPERGEVYYAEAKTFLESRVLNKTVKLEFGKDRYDKYDRILAYVFLDGSNVNEEIVSNGFANYYFYSGLDSYSDDLLEAWEACMIGKKNLCEPSADVCSQCISIEQERIVNTCSFSCNISGWWIKGEGREKFTFEEQNLASEKASKFTLDLSNSGGSLFLYDDETKLVEWKK